MKIEHVALWTRDLERARRFYVDHFGGSAGARYENRVKQFSSYFITIGEGARLELMQRVDVPERQGGVQPGWAHIALAVGSEQAVRERTEALRKEGVTVLSEPRWTGDGYFESVVADPDGNEVEITI